jgi:hypothetical protein
MKCKQAGDRAQQCTDEHNLIGVQKLRETGRLMCGNALRFKIGGI